MGCENLSILCKEGFIDPLNPLIDGSTQYFKITNMKVNILSFLNIYIGVISHYEN